MINQDKISLFLDMKKRVHISCEGKFYNGIILEIHKTKQFLILVDDKLGEVPIMFEEIKDIEPYTKKKVKDNGKL